MRFLRKNTAVIISVGPFYDATDGVTPETALTITNERITLVADTDDNSAPTLVLDNVTGATSGTSNDLNYITGQDNGMMQLELSASNTNRNGRMILTVTDAANHVPVFHEFMVLDAAVYDSLVQGPGTDVLDVNITQALATAITATGGRPEVNTTHVGGTSQTGRDLGASVLLSSGTGAGQVSLSSGTVTVGTNNDKTGYGLSSAAVQAIWDALTSALTTASSIGKLLVDNINATISSRLAAASITLSGGAVTVGTNNDKTGYSLTTTPTVKKNTALANFHFFMRDSADHVSAKTGLTITAERLLDGGTFAACANSASEVSAGIYKISLDAADLNANVVTLKFTATGADPTLITIVTER